MRTVCHAAALVLLLTVSSSAFAGSSELTVRDGVATLGGVWLAPHKPLTDALVIIPGSGPTDHDGNNPMGIEAAPYRLLAEELAKLGIGTLRIDKRGLFLSSGAGVNPNDITIKDYVVDTGLWLDKAEKKTGKTCIWLLGHSEGGLVALLTAKQRTDVCGVILVAAPGRPMGTILRTQLAKNPANAPLLPEAFLAIEHLEEGERVESGTLSAPLRPLFAASIQGFLISEFSYDPASIIKDLKKPVLVVQGTSDLQVDLADAKRLVASCSCAKQKIILRMTHVLKQVTSDSLDENKATYSNPNLPIAAELTPSIASFMRSHRRR